MYDAIIVGARCGGAPLAMLLARQGYRVLLVDRATFPSDIPHGHYIHRQGARLLARWGLMAKLVEGGTPPLTTMTTHFGDYAMIGTGLEMDGVPMGIAPRRYVVDAMLIEAAVDAGAELREHFLVEELLSDNGKVTGIRGRDTRSGATVSESARITIGADGRHSSVARQVNAPFTESLPTFNCYYFSYWSGVECTGVEVYTMPRRAIFAFPTTDGLLGIFVAWSREDLPIVRADIEGEFMKVIDAVPAFAGRVRAGRREESFRGATELPNFLRKPVGDGWALVGDAGCHKDPFLALGMGDALRDADLLATAIDDGLSGRRPLAEALAGYEDRRDALTRDDFRENVEFARLGAIAPERLMLRAALRGHQEDINQLYLATEGMIPKQAFFNPDTMQRIVARAQVAAAGS